MTGAGFPVASAVKVRNEQQPKVQQELAAPKAEPVSQRGGRPSEEEQSHSLGIGLA